jgi:hypothetical protein
MIPLSRVRHLLILRKILSLGSIVALIIAALPIAPAWADFVPLSEADKALATNIAADGSNDAPVTIAPEIATTSDDPTQLRGSLSMRAAPMSQIFTLLGAMTPLRFAMRRRPMLC